MEEVKQPSPPTQPVTNVANTSAPQAPAPNSHLIVFRNQQGVFLPGLSDNDEVQYWRILLDDDDAVFGQHIKDGARIRFCWRFQDQTTGYRDWEDDVFGRRRAVIPSGYDDDAVLYLKLPWPRFTHLSSDTNNGSLPVHPMLLAPVPEKDARAYNFKVLTADGKTETNAVCYVQDLVFRIDTVANDGHGDSLDYLLKDIGQVGAVVKHSFRFGNMSIGQATFWL